MEEEFSTLDLAVWLELAQAILYGIGFFALKTNHLFIAAIAWVLGFSGTVYFLYLRIRRRSGKRVAILSLLFLSLFFIVPLLFSMSNRPELFRLTGESRRQGLTYLGCLFSLIGLVWLIRKYWGAERKKRGSVEKYKEYLQYLETQKRLSDEKKVSYESFPTPLAFDDWKKHENK